MQQLIYVLGIAVTGLLAILYKQRKTAQAHRAMGDAEGYNRANAECKKQMAQQSKIYNEVIKGLNEYIKSIDKPDDMSNIHLGGVSDKPD